MSKAAGDATIVLGIWDSKNPRLHVWSYMQLILNITASIIIQPLRGLHRPAKIMAVFIPLLTALADCKNCLKHSHSCLPQKIPKCV